LHAFYRGAISRVSGVSEVGLRSFLLASVRHFLANEWDRTRTQKRGGRTIIIALDFEAAEDRFCREQASELTPEALFERHWALDVLEKALARLGEEYAVKGQWTRFEQLRPFLTRQPRPRRLSAGGNEP